MAQTTVPDESRRGDVVRAGRAGGASAWLAVAKSSVELLLLVAAVAFVMWHWNRFEGLFDRVVHSPIELSVAGFIKVSVPATATQKADTQTWLAVYRARSTKVRVVQAQFKDTPEGEFVEIEASTPTDLSAAFIGDGSKLLRLEDDPGHLYLKAGERLRIYTFRPEPPAPFVGGRKQTLAWCEPNPDFKDCVTATRRLNDGIFKGDVGEGDRVVLISRDAELLIDFDYWWPMAVPKRS
jgi:hypothetical protein